MDAVHSEYQSKDFCGSIKKSEYKTLQTTDKPSRLYFARALCLERMQLVVSMNPLMAMQSLNFLKNSKINRQQRRFHRDPR